jgi:RNA polymerase sigma-70 factor (ECF subfamily)
VPKEKARRNEPESGQEMSFPTQADELSLHERVLQREAVAPVDVCQSFVDPIAKILESEKACSQEDAYDSAIDAVFSYLRHPERYDRGKARLATYLTQAAKKRAIDRHRSTEARTRREQKFADVFELQVRTPKERLETFVEVSIAVERLDGSKINEKELELLREVFQGERSTRRLAEILGLASLPEDEMRREVKRHRDRLMKALERLGKEDPDDES